MTQIDRVTDVTNSVQSRRPNNGMITHAFRSTLKGPNRFPRRSPTVMVCMVAGVYFLLSNSLTAQTSKAPVNAEDGSTVYVIAKVRGEKNKVKDEIGLITANVTSLATQVTQAEQQRDYYEQKGRAFIDSDEVKQVMKDHDEHDAACVRQLSPGEYASCQRSLVSINERTAKVNSTIEGYVTQYKAQSALVQQLVSDKTLAMARMTKLTNYLSWLTEAEDKLSKSIAIDCKQVLQNSTIEELKHRCGNIQFDAARVDLPACDTERCEAWVIYTKPQRTPEQAIQDYKNSGQPNAAPNPHLDNRSVPPPSPSK